MTVIIPEDGGAVRFRRGAEGVRTAGAGVEPWVQAVATDYGPVCPRRIVMVRQEVEKRPKAAGKQVNYHTTIA